MLSFGGYFIISHSNHEFVFTHGSLESITIMKIRRRIRRKKEEEGMMQKREQPMRWQSKPTHTHSGMSGPRLNTRGYRDRFSPPFVKKKERNISVSLFPLTSEVVRLYIFLITLDNFYENVSRQNLFMIVQVRNCN